MEYRVNIVELTRQVFGNLGYLPSNNILGGRVTYPEVPVFETDDIASVSLLGNPIFDVVELYLEDRLELSLSDSPLITCNRPRIIVKTPIQGRDGTVKEFVTNDDWRLSIRGLIVDPQDKMPFDLLELYAQKLERPVSYKIVSRLTTALGITNIVVDSYSFEPVEGFNNVIKYDIQALSDDAPEISI